MPLPKRILIHNADLAKPEQLVENDVPIDLPTANFSRLLGTMRKLSMLSSIAAETFTNLSIMLEDINERTNIVATRADAAVKKLVEVEKGLRRVDLQPENNVIRYSQKYFKNRQVTIPPLFIKASNYSSIKAQYKLCREPPQLWRLENIVGDDLFQFFSFPGYFFQEWLRAELFKQEREKAVRKANKALKKQQKKEKKRKILESQKLRTKSFIGRPTSMKLVDKEGSRLSNAGSITSADLQRNNSTFSAVGLTTTTLTVNKITDLSVSPSQYGNNVSTPARPVSTAAAKLFADSPEMLTAGEGHDIFDDAASDMPTKKKKGGIKKVFGLFRSKDGKEATRPTTDFTVTEEQAAAASTAASAALNVPNSANNNWETASLASYSAAATRPTMVAVTLPTQTSLQQRNQASSPFDGSGSVDGTGAGVGTGAALDASVQDTQERSAARVDRDLDPAATSYQDFLSMQAASSSAAKRRKQQQQLVANKYTSKFQAKTGDVLLDAGEEYRPISILPAKLTPPVVSGSDGSGPKSSEHHTSAVTADRRDSGSVSATAINAKKRSSVLFSADALAPKRHSLTNQDSKNKSVDAAHRESSSSLSPEEELLQSLLGSDYRTLARDAVDDAAMLDIIEIPTHQPQPNSKRHSKLMKRDEVEEDDLPSPRPSELPPRDSFIDDDEMHSRHRTRKSDDKRDSEEYSDVPRDDEDGEDGADEDERNKNEMRDEFEDDGYDEPDLEEEEFEDDLPPEDDQVRQMMANRPSPPPPTAGQQKHQAPPQPPAKHLQPPQAPPQPQGRAPPPPPPAKQLKSALGTSVLETIRSGAPALRKVDPEELMKAKTPDLRTNILNSIKSGKTTLKHVSAEDRVKVSAARQNEAIQRLLANRRDIAGSDSEDDDSDTESEFSF